MAVPFWLVFGAGSLLLVPSGVFFAQCLVAASDRRPAIGRPQRRPRLCVMVPAHDEAEGIGTTLSNLQSQLADGDRLLVIADNCSDNTAEIARAAGATVIERTNEEQRGKGYAISYGLTQLDSDPPEVLVLVDADCLLSEDAIDQISRLALSEQRPVQAEYLLTVPEQPSRLSTFSALAFLIRNKVRPLGMAKLGFPCHLTGSGMAFPWALIRNSPALGDNLVEDVVMGLDMALAGHPPLFCPEAKVRSTLPGGKRAATAQRTRWEHGHVATLLSRGPRLLQQSVVQRRPELAAIALDLMVPPLAFLVSALGTSVVAGGVFGVVARKPLLGLLPPTAGLGLVTLGTLTAWSKFARDTVPLKVLLTAPMYVAWKLPTYLSLVFRGPQKRWVRTERTTTDEAPPETVRSGATPQNGMPHSSVA